MTKVTVPPFPIVTSSGLRKWVSVPASEPAAGAGDTRWANCTTASIGAAALSLSLAISADEVAVANAAAPIRHRYRRFIESLEFSADPPRTQRTTRMEMRE